METRLLLVGLMAVIAIVPIAAVADSVGGQRRASDGTFKPTRKHTAQKILFWLGVCILLFGIYQVGSYL